MMREPLRIGVAKNGLRKEIFLVFLLVIGIGAISAAGSQLVSVNYDFGNDGVYESSILSFSDVLLKINVDEGLSCKYSESPGVLYSNMQGNFEYFIGTSYYKNFIDLFDGNYKVYVKCQNITNTLYEPAELKVVLRINSLVTGQILLSENSPLRDGQVDVNLITSKVVSQAPILTYSFDGVKYNPVVLSGSEKNWKGYIVLDRTLGEGVLSFAMRAVDLEGRQGTEITVGSAFPYDTIIPQLITDIKAISSVGEIKLEWHGPEDAEEYRIYRSTASGVSYTDFYEDTTNEEYVDTDIERGKTYYYKISSVDSSGNEASLSREVSGISLEEYEDTDSGLSPILRGKVEGFILEIESVENEIQGVSESLASLSEEEKDLFTRLKMFDKISKATKDLASLKTTVEKYKDLDLTSEELDKRIESSRVKLGVFGKDVPSGIEIVEEKTDTWSFDEDFVMKGLYELDNFLSEKEKSKSVKETLNLIKNNQVSINSILSYVEVSYLDSSTEKFYILKRTVASQIENIPDAYFMELFPQRIIENGKVEVKTLDHDFLSDGVLTFGSGNKELFYYVQGINGLSELDDIEYGLVYLPKGDSSTGITGFSIFESGKNNSPWIIGVVFILLGVAYFFYSKKNSYSDNYFRALNKVSQGAEFANKDDSEGLKKTYSEIKSIYKNLSEKEKRALYEKIEVLKNDALILEFENALSTLSKTKNKNDLEKLKKIYSSLPAQKREKVSPLFNKLKGEVENEK